MAKTTKFPKSCGIMRPLMTNVEQDGQSQQKEGDRSRRQFLRGFLLGGASGLLAGGCGLDLYHNIAKMQKQSDEAERQVKAEWETRPRDLKFETAPLLHREIAQREVEIRAEEGPSPLRVVADGFGASGGVMSLSGILSCGYVSS
jgi:hypothetical protein